MDDFCREHYFHEIERRRALASSLSLPIGVVTVLGGILITVARAIDRPYSDLEVLFLHFVLFATIALGAAVYYLLRSHVGFTYGYIASPEAINDYRNSLTNYYRSIGAKVRQKKIEKEVQQFISSEYAKLADHNAEKNDLKSYYLHRANIAIVFTLIFTLLSSLPFIYNYANGSTEPIPIKIIE